MRYIILGILGITFLGCDSTDAPDCLKSSGEYITKVIAVDNFNQLIVNNEFNVVLTEGSTQDVKVTIGKNIIDDISFTVNDQILEIKNLVGCKWVRDYDYPLIEITSSDLAKIEIIGGSHVHSNGILNYPDLLVKSKDSNGIIKLDVNSTNLTIDNNEITNYYLSGTVINLSILFTSGDSRFEGTDLIATNALVSHSSSNDIIVNVINELNVTIRSTGDLIYVGQEPLLLNTTILERGCVINGAN